jgi:hypothetical protein
MLPGTNPQPSFETRPTGAPQDEVKELFHGLFRSGFVEMRLSERNPD